MVLPQLQETGIGFQFGVERCKRIGAGLLGQSRFMYHERKGTRQEEQGIQFGWNEEYVKQGWNVMFTECVLCARHMC